MKNFLRISFIIIISGANLHAQEGMNWYIGDRMSLNFECAPPYGYPMFPQAKVDYQGGNGSTVMNDTNGSLLFFSNGRSVYNRNGKAMPHGWHIMANDDSAGYIVNHVCAIPDPGNINRYYIFFTDVGDTFINGKKFSAAAYLNYALIDMSLDNGNGDVANMYHHIENNIGEGLTAAHHENKRDFWLVFFKQGLSGSGPDTIVSYCISPVGFARTTSLVLVSITLNYIPLISYDGKHIVLYQYQSTQKLPLTLLSFDNHTGNVTGQLAINPAPTDILGTVFSPDGTKLYVDAENNSYPYFDYIYQYDLNKKSSAQISKSQTVVYKASPNSGYDMRQACDGKIYGVDFNNYLYWSIDNPNITGPLLHVNASAIRLPYVPTIIGCPNFITRHPEFMPYTVSAYCNNMPAIFTPFQNLYSPVYHWDFGDPGSGTADTSTKRTGIHLYKNPGTYKVHLVCWNYDSITDTFTRFVCISKGLTPAKLDTTLCNGATVKLDAGNSGARYLWSTGDTVETKKVSSGVYWVEVSNGSCTITDTFHIAGIGTYKLNLGHDTTLAKGKTITLYTGYPTTIWSNGTVGDSIQVSQPGTYWAMLKGSNCQQADSIHILSPQKIDTNLCAGETINLDAGNSGARYLWSDGSTARTKTVSSGSYWVRISLSSFSITDSFKVIGLGSAKINLGRDTTIIQGTGLTLYSGYKEAKWSTGQRGDSIEVSQAGTYWAALNGDKCNVSDTIHVKTYVPPLVKVNMDANVCGSGGVATLDAGNPGATYYWYYNNNPTTRKIIVRGSGKYWVKITNASGSIMDTAHVIDISNAKINLGNDTTIASGAVLVLHSGYSSATWSTGAKGDTIHVTKGGTYWAALIGDSCEVSDTIIVKIMGGINVNNTDNEIDLSLQPNPAHGLLNINFDDKNASQYQIRIYDMSGKMLINKPFIASPGANDTDIDINALPPGTYIFNLIGNHVFISKRFEIN